MRKTAIGFCAAAEQAEGFELLFDGKYQPWGLVSEGRQLLQDRSDSMVSFCNLKVKGL